MAHLFDFQNRLQRFGRDILLRIGQRAVDIQHEQFPFFHVSYPLRRIGALKRRSSPVAGRHVHLRGFGAGGNLVDDGKDHLFHVASPAVIRLDGKIHAPLKQHFVADLLVLLPNRNGMAAVELGQLHARHVSQAVADINHVGKRHAPLFLRHEFVERAVLGHIQHALVHAEKDCVLLV